MKRYGVDTQNVETASGRRCFSSVVLLNEKNASRTCIFDKGNLPPLALSESQKKAVCDAKILMVDGNELDAAVDAARLARQHNTIVLYDAGGLYDGVEELLKYTDILIPSEEFAIGHTKKENAKAAAEALFNMYNPKVVVVTCGKKGGVMYDGSEFYNYPAYEVAAIDSNGAGDCFHGAFAFAVFSGYDYKKACRFSSAVSAVKCTKKGARKGTPDFKTVSEFLERNESK